jgi:peptide/nickel transport system permease protein
VASTLIGLILGVPTDLHAAVNAGGAFDRNMSGFMALVLAVSAFVLGTLLILLLAQSLLPVILRSIC